MARIFKPHARSSSPREARSGSSSRALECGADAVIADLEDAVTPAEKAGARELATRLLAEAGDDARRGWCG